MSAERPRTGLMNLPETDALEQLRKIVEPPTPKTLNAQIEALSDKQREQLNLFVSQLKLSMSFSRVNDRYADYKTLIRQMYPKLNMEFSELITDVMESLDPTPEMPPEIRYKRSLERKLTPKEVAMSIYDNPKYFPPRDAMKTEQVYRAPVSNNGGPNPRASIGGKNTAQQTEAPSATISSEETLFDFDNTALLKFKDTIGNIESANDYAVRGGFNDHYLGKYQMGKAALEDVGIGYSKDEQEKFLSDPEKQETAFEEFTKQNHEYLQSKSEKYRDLTMPEKLAVLGYAHNQGRGGALKYLETGESEKDGFGTDALMYVEEVTNNLGTI